MLTWHLRFRVYLVFNPVDFGTAEPVGSPLNSHTSVTSVTNLAFEALVIHEQPLTQDVRRFVDPDLASGLLLALACDKLSIPLQSLNSSEFRSKLQETKPTSHLLSCLLMLVTSFLFRYKVLRAQKLETSFMKPSLTRSLSLNASGVLLAHACDKLSIPLQILSSSENGNELHA